MVRCRLGIKGVAVLSLALGTLGVSGVPLAIASTEVISDPHSLGSFSLLDSENRTVTSGRTDVPLDQEITHARAPQAAPVGYRDASQLTMWTPASGADPSQWNGGPLGTSTLLVGAQKTAPMQALNVSKWSLDRDIILASGPSKGSFANIYQLRLIAIENGPSVAPGYYTLAIVVDPRNHTWRIDSGSGSSSHSGSISAGVVVVVVAGAGIVWLRRRRSHPVDLAQSAAAVS